MNYRLITVISPDLPTDQDIESYLKTLSFADPLMSVSIPGIADLIDAKAPPMHIVLARSDQGKEWLNHLLNNVQSEEAKLYQDLKVFLDIFPVQQLSKVSKDSLFVPKDKQRTRPSTKSDSYLEQYPILSFKQTLDRIQLINRHIIYCHDGTELTTWYDILKTIATTEHPYLIILKTTMDSPLATENISLEFVAAQ